MNVLLNKPVVYIRYVDDVFVMFKSKKHLKLFVNYMDSKHKYTKFTFQTEDSNSFSFLDVKLNHKKKKNSLSLLFFATPHLVEFLLITIVLFPIPTRYISSTHFCSGFSKFVPVWKILI